MRIRYTIAISEPLDELAVRERQLRGSKAALRLRLLILLKSGQAKNLAEAAALVGYSKTQAVRWWERYRCGGRAALEQEPHYPGQPARLTAEAHADLEAAMRRGQIATWEQARQYLRDQWGIEYQSVNGIWWHFRRTRTRKKTGRRRHQLASADQQQDF